MRTTCGILAAALAVAAVPAAYSEIKLVEPAPGAVVPLLTDAQKAYVSMDRQTRREKFADAKFRSEEMGLPAEKIPGVKRAREAFWPKTVRLAWEAKDGVEYRVAVRDTAKDTVVIDEKSDNYLEHGNRARMLAATAPGVLPVYDMHHLGDRTSFRDWLESAQRMNLPVHVGNLFMMKDDEFASPTPMSADDFAILRKGLLK